MADLLTELQQLDTAAVSAARGHVPACDPLLLDEVYTCPATQSDRLSSSSHVRRASDSTSTGATQATACTASPATVQHSNISFTSGANLTSLAALAAYKRQLYLGLDPASPAAAGQVGAAATRPTSAAVAAAPWQAGLAASRSFVLKSRPNGMSKPEFGPTHIPGYLPRPDPQDTAAASTPAQSGMGPVVAPRLYPRSSCPPAWPEPLTAPADADAGEVIAARQAEREAHEEFDLMNRLVYDSLQPPVPTKERENCAGAQPGSWSSSCRTTTSSKSLNTCGDDVDGNGSRGIGGSAQEQQQHEQEQQPRPSYAYTSGLVPWYVPEGSKDTTLVFESRFQSGNLRRAIQVTEFEYDLVLQPDINTRGHTQWFFFAVANTRAGVPYRFNIINLLKEDSLYNMGMLPLMHSEQQMRSKGLGWVRWGRDVCYGANNIVCRKKQTYYTLTFTMEFPHDGDLVHLAHCYPFTWTDQQNHLYALTKSPPPSTILQQALLATSLAGNAVDVLTITAAAERGRPMSQRQGVILSARVHPGETNASWLMKGALQQLLADTEESARLRGNFVFKVVPMLNPDGVIVGNYRCSLAGLDLNRMYQGPDSRLQPVICAFKEMCRAFTQEREVVLSCDMHGHSRRFGIFTYGCEKKPGKDITPLAPGLPVPGSLGGLPGVPVRHQERVFPLMLALNAPDLFSYRSCNFKVQKSKAGTGRVVGFRELGLVNAYTMEASFAGAAVGKYAKQHFNTGHLEEMGAAVVRTLLDYWAPAAANSAQELCAQLDAALLQGVTDSSSANAAGGSGSSVGCGVGGSGMGNAFEKLGLGDAGDDDDICTDSDDESSDDDKPAARNAAAAAAAAAEAEAGGSLSAAVSTGRAFTASVSAKGAGSGAANSAAVLADIGKQLADLLNGQVGPAGSSSKSVSGKAAAAAGSAAAGAVRSLLDAIKATEAAGNTGGGVAGGAAPNSGMVKPFASQMSAAVASNSAAGGNASSVSSSKQSTSSNPAQTVTAVAQQLLDKLAVAKAKVTAGAAAVTAACPVAALPAAAAASAAAVAACATVVPAASTTESSNASCLKAGSPGSLPKALPLDAMTGSTAAASPSAAVAAAAAAAAAGGLGVSAAAAVAAAAGAGGVGALSEEEAALLVMPGLQDILQQLVQQVAQQKSKAAATTAKKKGRRRGRWGNPEVLRAARAKADAGLAAALPELGILDADAEDLDADSAGCWDEGTYSSSSSTPATPTPAETPQVPFAGRRAHTAGSRSCKNASWNVERYMYCLEAQKRAVGGVLASSSTESPTPAAWGEGPVGGLVSPGAATAARGVHNVQNNNNQSPGVAGQAKLLPHSSSSGSSHSSSSPFGGSKSSSRKVVAFAGADDQPDALEASMTAGCGAAGERPSPGSSPPGVSLQRRSKSAYPWMQPQPGSPL